MMAEAAAAAAASEEDVLLQIQCLVSDSLQVVCYKWLSRNFSISSNAAKRLLHKFAERNENSGVEIVYAISGWTAKEPHTYAIQLVPKSKLEESRAAIQEPQSVHVYSVQRCLPTDPAQLWSAEFVQAEQLFKEPAHIDNCLRDNRYSAVTDSRVQRHPEAEKSRVIPPPQPLASNGVATRPPSSVTKSSGPAQSLDSSKAINKDDSGGKKPTPATTAVPSKGPHNSSKDASGSGPVGKKKSTAVTGGSGGGSALANMWGKAPPKAKSTAPPKPAAAATIAANGPWAPTLTGDAEAGIQAMEAEDGSEDDMVGEFTSLRRGQVNNTARTRRMILDDDGDDEDENGEAGVNDDEETIVRLGTPESPQERGPTRAVAKNTQGRKERTSKVDEKLPDYDGKSSKDRQNSSSFQEQANVETKTKRTKTSEEKGRSETAVPASDLEKGGSKRKKVIKTKIDARGREVTEVVWEPDGEGNENVKEDVTPVLKHAPSSSKEPDQPQNGKAQTGQKSSSLPSKTPGIKGGAKATGKSASKPVKGQGNIMSFFKKT